MDPVSLTIMAGGTVLAIGAASATALKAWNNWLEFKKLELGHGFGPGAEPRLPLAGGRIEIADLKERIRKLEAIAEGIDL